MKKRNWIKYGIGALIAGAAMITLMGFATMYLWNWLIPEIFNGSTVTFWQAIGLLALGKLLTGFMGVGRHSWSKGGHSGWSHKKDMFWKQKMEDKMANMTDDERAKFKQYYYNRCGWKTSAEPENSEKAQAGQ